MNIYIYMYIYVCVYIYTYIYVSYMYKYICIYIYIRRKHAVCCKMGTSHCHSTLQLLQRAVAACCRSVWLHQICKYMYLDNNESKKNRYKFDVLFGSSTTTHMTFPDRILVSFKYRRRTFWTYDSTCSDTYLQIWCNHTLQQHAATAACCLNVRFYMLAFVGRSDAVQHTATHCNTLHHIATHCTTLHHTEP